jgi:hypothetical protein
VEVKCHLGCSAGGTYEKAANSARHYTASGLSIEDTLPHRKQTETGFEARDQVPLQEINPSTNDGFEYLLHEQLARYAQTTSCFTAEALGAHLADEAFAIADARFPQSSIAGVVVKVGKLTALKTSDMLG